MIINDKLHGEILEKVKKSPHLCMNIDLRNSAEIDRSLS